MLAETYEEVERVEVEKESIEYYPQEIWRKKFRQENLITI